MKKIALACGLFGVIGIGCGGNKCQALSDVIEAKYLACNVAQQKAGSGDEAECPDWRAKQDECLTPCYENMDCVLLTDPTSSAAGMAQKDFDSCVADCLPK
jgi:hypothetical protein